MSALKPTLIVLAVLAACAAPAQAAQTVGTTAGSNLGVIDQLTAPEVFSDSPLSLSTGAGGNLSFTLALSNSPFVLEITGTAPAGTSVAGYTGLITASPVPEPSTWALAAAGLLAVVAGSRRRSNALGA